VASDRQDITRAERLGRLIADRLSTIDRSSLRDREALVASLVDFELLLRSAERAAVWESGSPSSTREAEIQLIRLRVSAARRVLSEAVETAALDELTRAAWVHLGFVREDSLAPTPEIPEATVPVRLRRLGQPRRFEGESDGSGQSLAVLASSNPSTWLRDPQQVPTFAWVAIALPPIVWALVRGTGQPSLTGAVLLVLTLAVTAVGAGVWSFLAALLMAGLGWLTSEDH